MPTAVPALAFASLAANNAKSVALARNAVSHRVSRRLDYVNDGVECVPVRGEPVVSRRLAAVRIRASRSSSCQV